MNKMISISLISILMLVITTTTATPFLNKRAGGPIPKPIPANCSLPCASNYPPTPAFAPVSSFAPQQIYSFILPVDDFFNETEQFQTCLEQCYGYGNPGDCKGILWAQNVTENEFGSPATGTACLFFGATIRTSDLQAVTNGTYTAAKAINIQCPHS